MFKEILEERKCRESNEAICTRAREALPIGQCSGDDNLESGQFLAGDVDAGAQRARSRGVKSPGFIIIIIK